MDRIKEIKHDFSLSKWYMDCIDADGNVFIGYSVVLKWKQVKLNYTNILRYENQHTPQSQTTFKTVPSPVFRENHLSWAPAKLGIRGTWNSVDAPIRKTLLHTDSGIIRWECNQPKAIAAIITENDNSITGLGYTEKLEMTIKPWELQFNELRWGRFLSEEDTMVWVNWRGKTNLNLLFYQGKQIEDIIVSDETIKINRGEALLTFSDKVVLRKGPLISTALSNFPGIESILPNSILNTYECKWRSNGVLKKNNNEVSKGWVIHEVVRWQ